MNIKEYTKSQYNIDITELGIYIMYDQPPNCSLCYGRADIIEEFAWRNFSTQLCQCNNKECGFIFLEQEDDYFNIDYWLEETRE
jgi:hypothetical protein